MTIELNNISSGYSTGLINNNFQSLEEYINSNLLNRDGLSTGEANQMDVPLDMNSNDILNIGTLRADDLILSPDNQTYLEQIQALVLESENWSELSEAWASNPEDVPVENSLYSSFHYSRKASGFAQDAGDSASLAESHKTGAQNAEAQAQAYSELGLAAGDAFDLGFISDDIIYFPTNWGSVA